MKHSSALALAVVLAWTFATNAWADDDAAKKNEPAKTTSTVPIASRISWGVGGVALLSFAAFAAKARVDYDDYETRCAPRCAESERDTVKTSIVIADISLVVAIVAAGVGTFFYLTRPTVPARDGSR